MEQWKLAAVMGAVALGGVALGGLLFGSRPAQAQRAEFTECFLARQESVDTNAQGLIGRPGAAETIRIPSGYTVVSGGGVGPNWLGSVVLCR